MPDMGGDCSHTGRIRRYRFSIVLPVFYRTPGDRLASEETTTLQVCSIPLSALMERDYLVPEETAVMKLRTWWGV